MEHESFDWLVIFFGYTAVRERRERQHSNHPSHVLPFEYHRLDVLQGVVPAVSLDARSLHLQVVHESLLIQQLAARGVEQMFRDCRVKIQPDALHVILELPNKPSDLAHLLFLHLTPLDVLVVLLDRAGLIPKRVARSPEVQIPEFLEQRVAGV